VPLTTTPLPREMRYCGGAGGACYTFRPVPSGRAFVPHKEPTRVANPEGRCTREVGLSQNVVVVLAAVFGSTSAFALAKCVWWMR